MRIKNGSQKTKSKKTIKSRGIPLSASAGLVAAPAFFYLEVNYDD